MGEGRLESLQIQELGLPEAVCRVWLPTLQTSGEDMLEAGAAA